MLGSFSSGFSSRPRPDVPISSAETAGCTVTPLPPSPVAQACRNKVMFYTASVGVFPADFYRDFRPDFSYFVSLDRN